MERLKTAIIGGGAAGLITATALDTGHGKIALFERGDRVGKKLSATGNGQGNVTNAHLLTAEYFSVAAFARDCEYGASNGDQNAIQALCQKRTQTIIRAYDHQNFIAYLKKLGVLVITDERGRVYPAGRQASAVTDALRFFVAQRGVEIRLQTKILSVARQSNGYVLTAETPDGKQTFFAENVIICAGGKAAKNFGTDGNGYALAQAIGHTLTELYPSLVQLKTDTAYIKTLKGIRVNDGILTARVSSQTDQSTEKTVSLQGDIIFTDYGVSGDAVFRISAFIAAEIATKRVTLSIDFLPDFTQEEIENLLREKQTSFPNQPTGELLCGVVNNQIGRAILKRADNDLARAAALAKNFPLTVTGSLGFDYAQVTKGGIPLTETDDGLQSLYAEGVYFAGEILDVDGECGGFNLQWAYSSARAVAAAINQKYAQKGE